MDSQNPTSYECVRCGYKADNKSKMQTHIDRKTKCKLSENGLDIDIAKYKTQILNHTFETMLNCLLCNARFEDKDDFITHKMKCDEEMLKKIPKTVIGNSKCEFCSKTFKFKDINHIIICNDVIEDYKKIEDERNEFEEQIKDLKMINRKLNDELVKFTTVVNKCIDDYVNSQEVV